jgi:hypothetical protein
MKKALTIGCVALLLGAGLMAGTQMKMTGPSGQGTLIIWDAATGVTNMTFGTNGSVTVIGTLTSLGGGSSSPTLVSNSTLKVYASNVVVTTSITVPSDSLEADDIGAGSLPSDVTVLGLVVSNKNSAIYGSNVTARGTVILPGVSGSTTLQYQVYTITVVGLGGTNFTCLSIAP